MAFPTSTRKAFPTSTRQAGQPAVKPVVDPAPAAAPAKVVAPVTVMPQREVSSTAASWRLQAGLEAARSQHQKAFDNALATLQSAEAYLSHKDEVTAALEVLSARAQARSKGLFEGLLTTLVREVMPEKVDQVRLTSGLRNHKRTLEVDVEINGAMESVFRDKGGAFKNLISMGLRFIVLSRSANRRFLVFDEADCWLKPDHIPAVAQLVYELSHRIGVQLIYISHHNAANFAGKARIVRLTSDGDTVVTEVSDEPPAPQLDGIVSKDENADLAEGLGLQYVRLVNFKRHEATHIPLSPNVTVICGDNDVGKSAIVQALECVTENAGRTGVIRHGAEHCEVEIGLEDNLSLSWRYRRNGARKTLYTLTAADGRVINEYDRATEVPEWLHGYLAMAPVGGFDLHLQRQTEPNFLIDDSLPATRRAELLSLGREAYYVQQMSVRHAEKVAQLRREANQAQRMLAEERNRLEALKALDELTERLKTLDAERQALEAAERDRVALGGVIERMEKLQTRLQALDAVVGLQMPKAPEIHDTQAMAALMARMEACQARLDKLAVLDTLIMPKAPELHDTAALTQLGARMAACQKRLDLLASLPAEMPKAPDLIDVAPLAGLIERLSGAQQRMAQHDKQLREAKAASEVVAREKAALIEELGGVCPTCDNALCSH